MASLFIVGNDLLEKKDYESLLEDGVAVDTKGLRESDFMTDDGSAEVAAAAAPAADPQAPAAVVTAANTIPFKPIGIGLPLSVEILTIYTGDFIRSGFLAPNKRDILCSSGVRAPQVFNEVGRAINLIQSKVKEKQYLQFSALEKGTPYVYYSAAVDSETLNITIELDADNFPDELLNTVGDLLSGVGGLPLFMPAASFLMAGSKLVKIAADSGNKLFQSKPFLQETISLRFATAGLPTDMARQVLLCKNEHVRELSEYKMQVLTTPKGYDVRLVKGDKVYDGDCPYLIVNIDGAEKRSLESFTPTLASSAVLKKFIGGDNKAADASELLFEAMKLYNDVSYRRKADQEEKNLKKLSADPTSDEYKKAKALYDAYVKNIQNDLLKKDTAEVNNSSRSRIN